LLEVLMGPVATVVALVASATQGFQKVPPWVLLMYPLLALRAKLVEADLQRMSLTGLLRMDWKNFFLSAPSTFDGATHGVMVATMFLGETSRQHARAVSAWSSSAALSYLVPVVDSIQMGGLAVVVLASCLIFKGCFVIFSDAGTDDDNRCMIAKMAGFGSLVAMRIKHSSDRSLPAGVALVLASLQGMGVAAPTLFVQTSYEMAKGTSTGSPDYVGLVSIFFAVLMLWKVLAEATIVMIVTRRDFFQNPQANTFPPILFIMWGLAFLFVARVAGIVVCPSSEWGMETGCVPACGDGVVNHCVPP